MRELDLFKDWSPEMIEALKTIGRGSGNYERNEVHRKKISEALIGHSVSEETKRRISGSRVGITFSKEHCRRLSEAHMGYVPTREARRRMSESAMGHTVSWETKEKISGAHMGRACSEETRRKLSDIVVSEAARKRMSEARVGIVVSEETRRKLSEAQKSFWGSLTSEERDVRMRNSFLSDRAIKNKIEACHQRPTMPERLFNSSLQKKCPGKWIYNGDNSQKVRVGNRIPDFIRVDGTKEAISVMGGLGFAHFLGDEENEVEHYKRYGWKCVVVWEWDI